MSEGSPAATPPPAKNTGTPHWIELIKVLALPLVTLVVGYWFNTSLDQRQQAESNIRLYAEMTGRREEADSNLRKDMFNSILTTFMSKDAALKPEQQLRQEILSLELLAHNFQNRSTSDRCSRTSAAASPTKKPARTPTSDHASKPSPRR